MPHDVTWHQLLSLHFVGWVEPTPGFVGFLHLRRTNLHFIGEILNAKPNNGLIRHSTFVICHPIVSFLDLTGRSLDWRQRCHLPPNTCHLKVAKDKYNHSPPEVGRNRPLWTPISIGTVSAAFRIAPVLLPGQPPDFWLLSRRPG